MLKVLIDDKVTCLYRDNGIDGINGYTDEIIGFFMNTNGIKEIISSIPIRKIYQNNRGFYEEITMEQAMTYYDEITQNKKEKKLIKE